MSKRNKLNLKRIFVATLLIISALGSYGQFYNGLQMEFGKNRIQYARGDILESDFYYSFFRFKQFDVYFHPDGQDLAKYVGEKSFQEIALLENYFEHSLSKRIIFLVFNKLSDFRQSNIGLITGQDNTNIGGTTRILDNKVFLYFDGDHKHLDQQIRAAVAQVMLNEMLYLGSVRERVTTSTLLQLPEWFTSGLISYVSKNWDIEIENKVKDGILSGRFEKFNRLTGEEALYAGHSIWYYIAEEFGEAVIPTIIYFTKINRNGSSGFLNVLGVSLNSLSYDWLHFYKSRYAAEGHQGVEPGPGQVPVKNRKQLKVQRTRISPDGTKIAYSTLQHGQIKIYLYDELTGKRKRIYKQGAKLQQIADDSYPAFAWHPSSQLLAMSSEYKGKIRYSLYPLEIQKWEHQELKNFEKVLDFDYADDGLSIVLSGVMKGQSDIFIHNLVAHTTERITDDIADDFNPRFVSNSDKIIFSSNRSNDSVSVEDENHKVLPSQDLFLYDYVNHSELLTRIAGNEYVDHLRPIETSSHEYVFLGDNNGIRNSFTAKYDSIIAFIDTTTHYRYFTRTQQLSHFNRNILDHSYSTEKEQFNQLFLKNNDYLLQLSHPENQVIEPTLTAFRAKLTRDLRRRDSLIILREKRMNESRPETRVVFDLGLDSISYNSEQQQVNINNYVFNEESRRQDDNFRISRPTGRRDPVTGRKYELPSHRIYQPAFYMNYLASQVDFSFLNASYQPFTGGAVYYNPGFNMLFKVGTQDLFEDYKITGGVRFGADFDSNEYLVSFQNLKYRFDHEVIFHRQAYTQPTVDYYSLVKTSSNAVYYVGRFPFSQVASIRATASMRSDNNVFLSTDQYNMMRKNIQKYWAGTKLEFVYDNTFQHGLNLYEGIRTKVFGEYYKQINGQYSNVFVVGGDLRYYLPLHRTLIWANRFAASSSFGSGRLIYYMGAVDNWTNLSREVQTFDNSVPIDTTQYFVFQTLATNMRGFSQNIRNGNSFAVFNSELRWPIVRYFANRPINSDFLNNLQLIAFFDMGTAWSGPSPWHEKNHLNREIIENGPLTIVIDKGNEPIVAGYGFGVRSRLLGYYVRLDWAWGIENYVILPRLFHLSLSLDF
ncbi:MAG: hypothetical protein HN352_16985 [Bacteroidetes bacterium]|jgi:hypothetical protein|nr:hypothetical protein [Bacteroidota bacterium]MBT4401281.1 hypothetical protein [Bacteroidota bacterium]MBT4411597.1 hypothetical protein [Bacteroidota bacterium]MBT7941516.1 hypothetical protein [Candidatus Neomarinimicrobiota bacterium]